MSWRAALTARVDKGISTALADGRAPDAQAKRLSGHPAGWNTLLHGLSQPIMDSTAVEQHLTVGPSNPDSSYKPLAAQPQPAHP